MSTAAPHGAGPAPPLEPVLPAGPRGKPTPELPDPTAEEIAGDNPFAVTDWRMKSYTWAGYVLRFILIFGAIFSVVQFLDAREEKRVERALELAEAWERPEYQEAQKALRERLADLNARHASILGPNPSPDELDVYYDRVGLEAMTAEGGAMPLPQFQEQFDRVVYFLNRVSFCVEGNMCSADVSDAYFGDYAQSFWRYFSGYVQAQRRRGQPNLAKPIETYVARTQVGASQAEAPQQPAADASPPVAQAPAGTAPQLTSGAQRP